MRVFTVLIMVLLVGCSSSVEQVDEQANQQPSYNNSGLHYYAAALVRQLISKPMKVEQDAVFAVGTFLPVKSLSLENETQGVPEIALQMQESVATLLTQAGFTLVEVKTVQEIALNSSEERFLSRDKSQLQTQHVIDYFVSGTIATQQENYVVNVKIIDTRTKNVLAAATRYMPKQVAWSHEKVMQRDGLLYRSEY